MTSVLKKYEKAFRKAFNLEKPNKRMTLEEKYVETRMQVTENNKDIKNLFIFTLGWFSASSLAFLAYFYPECFTSKVSPSLALLITAACFMFSCVLGVEVNLRTLRKAGKNYKESRSFKARESHANKKTRKR